MAGIRLEQVAKVYPNGFVACQDLDLEIRDGELMVLVGPSGSGKSTVLRMIAGLETATSGRLWIGEREVTHLPPQDRDIAMVFQSYALYPHMTVRENLGFGLRMRKIPSGEIEQRVGAVADSLGLTPMLERRPAQLSGGQRQRVALGRAIVREPLAFLFDEPLSNLDAKLRVETRAELSRLHRRLQATMVYVTHDQIEAMTLGDRVAVLHEGVLQQVAPPMELYHSPANSFVAQFIGSPGMNLFRGSLVRDNGSLYFRGSGIEVPLPREPAAAERQVLLGIRPHDIRLIKGDTPPVATAEVGVVEPLGNEQVVHLSTAEESRFIAVVPPDLSIRADEQVTVHFPPRALHLFDAGDERRIEND